MYRCFRFVQGLLAFIILLNIVACATPITSSRGPATTTSQATIAPIPHPEPWDEDANSFVNLIDWSVLQLAIILPYGGNGPDSKTCGEFWNHQLQRHISGDAVSQHSGQEISNFLAAVANGTAELVKVAVRSGSGIAALFRFNGSQWLFFIGEGLNPSAYKPLNQEVIRKSIQGAQIFKNPSNALKLALQTSARCFQETAPETVTVEVGVEVKVPVSEFSGQYDFNLAPTPVVGVDATTPVLIPVPVGSYGLKVPIVGTPPAMEVANYVYDPSHAAYVWSPQGGGGGLTPLELAHLALLSGGVIIIVGVITTTAGLWLPVVVVGAPSAAALVPAFAP